MDDSAFPKVVSQQPQQRRPKTLLILAVFLVLLGVLLFAGSQLLTTKSSEKNAESNKPAPTAIIAPSDTPAPTESPTPTPGKKGTPTLTPSPTGKQAATTTSVDKATGLDRSTLTVEVQNGSGVSGAASKMSTLLKDAGYTVGTTGNADNFDYQGVTIQVKSTKSKYLPLLKKDVSASYTVTDSSTSLASSTADAVIIVGK